MKVLDMKLLGAMALALTCACGMSEEAPQPDAQIGQSTAAIESGNCSCEPDGSCDCTVTEEVWWEPRTSTVQYTGGYRWNALPASDPCYRQLADGRTNGVCDCEIKFEKYKFTRQTPTSTCDDCEDNPQCSQTVTLTKVTDGWATDWVNQADCVTREDGGCSCMVESACSTQCGFLAGTSTVSSWFKLGAVADKTVGTVTRFMDWCGW